MGNPVTNKRAENRRENMRRLVDAHGGPKAFAEKCGYKTASFIVQMTGPNPSRPVTEDTARRVELALGLSEGSLDWPVNGNGKANARGVTTTAPVDISVGRDIMQMILAIASQEKVELPSPTFAEIASFAMASAKETGSVPSQDTLKHLVRAIKSARK